MLKVMIVFGTRPEAIKMAPLILELKKHPSVITPIVVTTAQHREMLDQVMTVFNLVPDFDLNVMKNRQSLTSITTTVLEKVSLLLEQEKPDIVLVHGDTTTTFATSLAAFYQQIKVGHVEAGLRTYDKYSPFPEELNRQFTGVIADYHFAPTENAKENLLSEGKVDTSILVTGNTAIDALKTTINSEYSHPIIDKYIEKGLKMILLTAHRRENLGTPLENIFEAVKKIHDTHKDTFIVYPVHLNPLIEKAAKEILGDSERIHLIPPLSVLDFHNFVSKSYLILTDSGGIQEEAPSLGKPVLVLRKTTERPEGVKVGTLKLVGTDTNMIYQECTKLLNDKIQYKEMSTLSNPFGDGNASKKIVEFLLREFN